MKWLQFIGSHSIFISICAVALCFQTSIFFQTEFTGWFYIFIFFSTLCSYNFYWLLSGFSFTYKKATPFLKKQYSNLIVFVLSLIGTAISVMHVLPLLPFITLAALLTILYSLPLLPVKIFQAARKAGVFKTILLAFTWTFITVLIPYQLVKAGDTITAVIVFSSRFLFMLMLCIIFDARDTAIDKIRGLQSITTMITPQTIKFIMHFLFAAYILNAFAVGIYIRELKQISALLITGAAVAVVYRFSLQHQGYFFYYFLVDGLMLFLAIASYVATI
jgi:4-hydroxybenzoate polyprenyltransferase